MRTVGRLSGETCEVLLQVDYYLAAYTPTNCALSTAKSHQRITRQSKAQRCRP